MAEITPKDTIKSWFKRGLKPLESQFHAWMDSYWHKSEKLSVSNIDKLETILNNKAESTALDQIDKNFNAHIQDTDLHKTEDDRHKLEHLAYDPEATYAKKDELEGARPLLLHATFTAGAETRTYTFPETEQELAAAYFANGKTRPVVLFVSETEESADYESYVMIAAESIGTGREMRFRRSDNEDYLLTLKFTQPTEGEATGFALEETVISSSAPAEVVVFTATYSSDTNTYTLDPGQDAKFEEYIDGNKSIPAFLHITDTGAPWYTAVLEHVDTSTTTKKMLFSVLDSGIIVQFVIKKLKLSLGWTGTLSLSQNLYPIEESEYKWERYYPETDFDMNEWFESGGISAAIYEGVEGEYEGIAGSNMPEGFTEFTGYVLAAIGLKSKSRKASIQVVTDKVLKKTMMRTGYERESSREEHEWLPWVEIGGGSPSTEPVVFTGTVAISGTDKTYALDDGQTSKFTQYFDDGMEVPVLLKFSSDSNYLHNEIFVLQDTTINGSARRMNFVDIGTGVITKLYLQMSRISSGAWVGVVKLITNEYKFGEPEYNANRYFGNDFDMNECTESGGILATSTETAPSAIQNGPGFDNFTGFVLKSFTITGDKKTCTQIVSDRDTGRIMMRFAYLESDFANVVWSEWKEIGGAPAGDNVYVVQEYPSDLSQYADGSIFIKEEATV